MQRRRANQLLAELLKIRGRLGAKVAQLAAFLEPESRVPNAHIVEPIST